MKTTKQETETKPEMMTRSEYHKSRPMFSKGTNYGDHARIVIDAIMAKKPVSAKMVRESVASGEPGLLPWRGFPRGYRLNGDVWGWVDPDKCIKCNKKPINQGLCATHYTEHLDTFEAESRASKGTKNILPANAP